MNDTRTLLETGTIRKAIADLGFRPAILDYSTMTMYWSFDGLGGPPRLTLMAGFEREGFFYTRAAAERAVRDWLS
jgi:hypothetical protein